MPLTDANIEWLIARQHADADLLMLTVFHPMIGVYRFVRNNIDVVSRGQTFSKCWFQLDIINDDGASVRSTLTFPHLGKDIAKQLRTLVGAPECTIEVVNSAEPDDPVYRAARLKMRNINKDPIFFSSDLQRGDDNSEICGTIRMTPSRAPALFRAL